MSLQRIPMKLLTFTKLDMIIGTVRFICCLNEKTNSEKRDIVKNVYPGSIHGVTVVTHASIFHNFCLKHFVPAIYRNNLVCARCGT